VSTGILILLRIVHIFAGVMWVGAAVSYFVFVEPTVKGLGPAAPKFMQDFIDKRRYPMFMNIVSALTIVAGALLFWNTSGGLQRAWFETGAGIGYTIGAVVAIAVFFIGFFTLRPRAERMGTLGMAVASKGGPPSPEQAAEMEKIGVEMHTIERIDVILLTVSLLAMAMARYL